MNGIAYFFSVACLVVAIAMAQFARDNLFEGSGTIFIASLLPLAVGFGLLMLARINSRLKEVLDK